MLVKVDTIRTKFSVAEFVNTLVRVWTEQFNKTPTKEQIGVIFSQWSLESGQGASCYNYNICNIKAVDKPGQTIEYCALNNVWEIINGKKVILSADNPGSWFRAFSTLEDGIKFYLDFLKNTRYKKAWSAIEAGDPADFAHKLKLASYYTASESDYTIALKFYFKKFMKATYYEEAIELLTIKVVPIEIEIDDPVIVVVEDKPIELTFWQKIIDFIMKIFSR